MFSKEIVILKLTSSFISKTRKEIKLMIVDNGKVSFISKTRKERKFMIIDTGKVCLKASTDYSAKNKKTP